ncbi:unnamed protein product, partial [Pylaiella littoralis]
GNDRKKAALIYLGLSWVDIYFINPGKKKNGKTKQNKIQPTFKAGRNREDEEKLIPDIYIPSTSTSVTALLGRRKLWDASRIKGK